MSCKIHSNIARLTIKRVHINEGNHGLPTLSAQNIIVVSTLGFALEHSAPMFDKICRYSLGLKLVFQIADKTFKFGAFLLKLGNLLFERLCLQSKHRVGGNVCNEFDDGLHKRAVMPNGQAEPQAPGLNQTKGNK